MIITVIINANSNHQIPSCVGTVAGRVQCSAPVAQPPDITSHSRLRQATQGAALLQPYRNPAAASVIFGGTVGALSWVCPRVLRSYNTLRGSCSRVRASC